jgi:hypothetical protein
MYTNADRFLLTLVIVVLVLIAATQLPPLIDSLNERLINSVVTTRKVTL